MHAGHKFSSTFSVFFSHNAAPFVDSRNKSLTNMTHIFCCYLQIDGERRISLQYVLVRRINSLAGSTFTPSLVEGSLQ